MQTLHPVTALGGDLIVHDNVLVPRSQPLITLMKKAMEVVRADIFNAPRVESSEAVLAGDLRV